MATDRHECIRQRAYALWEREGRPEGRAEQHWHRAEAEVAGAPPNTGGDADRGGAAPAMGSSDGTRAVPPGSEAGRDAAAAAVKARDERGRERAPSDLAADEAARGGIGVGPSLTPIGTILLMLITGSALGIRPGLPYPGNPG